MTNTIRVTQDDRGVFFVAVDADRLNGRLRPQSGMHITPAEAISLVKQLLDSQMVRGGLGLTDAEERSLFETNGLVR